MNKQQGSTGVLILLIVIIVGGGAYLLLSGNDNEVAPPSSVLGECEEFRDDICGLFDCMTPGCWCKDDPSGGVVYQEKTTVSNEASAERVVTNYLSSVGSGDYESIRATRLNVAFFNVCVEDERGDEEVFTVSERGEVLVTICGV